MGLPSREQLRGALLRYVEAPGARILNRLGFTPNGITFLGFGVACAGAGLVAAGYLLAGGLVFLFGSVLDLFDGALARHTGQATPFGALLDSVLDRLGEAALFLGLAIYAIREVEGEQWALFGASLDRLMLFMVLLLLALVFSQAVSYARARGEGLGIETRAGFMTRPERVVILGVCVAVGYPEIAMVVIAAISAPTLIQRVWHIRRQLALIHRV